MTAPRVLPIGQGDFFTNDFTSLWGLPHGTALGSPTGAYSRTSVYGSQSLKHPPNATLNQAPDRVQWVTDQFRRGNGCLRFETRHLDYGGTANNRNQIENSWLTDGTPDGRLYAGDDVFIATSFKLSSSSSFLLSGTNPFYVLFQLFAASADNSITGGSPPFALELQNTTMSSPSGVDFSITVRGGDGVTAPGGNSHFTRIAPALLDVWWDFLIRYKMGYTSSDPGGRVQVWLRQAGSSFKTTPHYDYTGITLRSVGGVPLGVQHSFGTYRNDLPNTVVVYMGELSTRNTRAEAEEIYLPIPVVTGAATFPTAVAGDAPAGWWKLGETSGTSATDSSTNTNPGTYTNSPTLNQAGAYAGTGQSVLLNGTSQYITIPNISAYNFGDNCSMEAIVKFTGAGTYIIMSKGVDSLSSPTHVPELSVTAGQLRFTIPQVNTIATAAGTINDNAWHYVVATKAGASVHLYVDGNEVTNSGTLNVTLANNTKAWTIGVRDQIGSFIDYFPGNIQQAVVYNYALTSTQVLMHYFNRANP